MRDRSAVQMHEIDKRPGIILHVCEHIGIGHVGLPYDTFGIVALHNLILLLGILSLLEFPFFGKRIHLVSQISFQLHCLSVENLAHA